MKFSREIRTGLIMVVGIAVLFWGVNYLKGNDFFTRQRTVFAVYDQVEGLTSTNPVMVNGMKVGMIHQLTLQPNGQIIVSMHVTNKVIVPRNSTAEIFSTDLLGSKGIRLVFGDSKEDLVDGDTMTAGVQQTLSEQVNAQVAPIKAKAESLLSSIDSILLTVRAVFNENTKNNLKRSFESISNSLASIENVAGSLDTVLAKQGRLRVIFDNIESITT
ncbi:MAG TPA: MlaD family protein, partial [Bacteroidia bacterium]|nr:MlaD family protein [Bacteroidia bacterium]